MKPNGDGLHLASDGLLFFLSRLLDPLDPWSVRTCTTYDGLQPNSNGLHLRGVSSDNLHTAPALLMVTLTEESGAAVCGGYFNFEINSVSDRL